MPKYRTENNVPNLKVIVGTVVGMAIPLYLSLASYFNLPTFDPEWMKDNVEEIVGGVVAIVAIVQYFTAPGKNDGVKEK